MGKLLQGINGPISGKVGPVVGATWRGGAVIRSRPGKRKAPYSTLELAQQVRFSKMSGFLTGIRELLNMSFKPQAARLSGYNLAFSYNVKNGFTGTYPELTIDHSMILVGRGDLPNAGSPTAIFSSANELFFKWTDNSGKGKARATDQIYTAVYSEKDGWWNHIIGMAQRKDGEFTMDITKLHCDSLHAYIGFMSVDGSEISDSFYLGLLEKPVAEIVLDKP